MSIEPCSALAPGVVPPERIELDELLLRRWQLEDLLPRLEAINASFDEIHPWMDWLAEPATLESQRAFGRETDESWPSAALPGVDRVEIHCDEANVRSAAVARRLGYRLDRIEPREKRAPAESGRGMYWVKER
ncbi:hypothetical protein [Nocardia sp. NPDC047038]|uniref:GNAT family N-acetyltransferase n=1 Tax=Nocardia sp. NPDC047038 TaxID=3154338 RepID=UPI0033CFE7B4